MLSGSLMLSCLTACGLIKKEKITCKQYENCAVFTLDYFEGSYSVKLPRTVPGEGEIYYQVNLKHGRLTVNYKEAGLIRNEYKLAEFCADDEMPVNGSGGYVEGDEIEISFGTLSPVEGEIIIAFTEDALKAVHGNMLFHEHTFTYTSAGAIGHYCYSMCGCPNEEGTTPHYDENTDYLCDFCKCDMKEFADQWLYDETHHWYVSDDGAVYCYGEHENRDTDSICDICGLTDAGVS